MFCTLSKREHGHISRLTKSLVSAVQLIGKEFVHTIAIEEHFTTLEFLKALRGFVPETPASKALQAKLLDLGHDRLAAMDAGAVDMQVLSLSSSGFEKIPSDAATAVAQNANDELAEAVMRHPTRFAGFASLNLKNVATAAKEF